MRSCRSSSPTSAASCSSNFCRWLATLAAVTSSSAGVAAAARRGAAATNCPARCATLNAADISGTLRSLTKPWASPTWLNENQATKLAAMVSATAVPMPA